MKLQAQQNKQPDDGSWHVSEKRVRKPQTLEGRSDSVELLWLCEGNAYAERGGCKQTLHAGDLLIGGLLGARTSVVPTAADGCRLLHLRLPAEMLLGLPQDGRLLAMLYAACAGEIVRPHAGWAQAMRKAAESLAGRREGEGAAGQAGRRLLQYAKLVELLGYLYEGLSGELTGRRREDAVQAVEEKLLDAVAYMIEHVTGDVVMTTVIRRSGLGKTQFYEAFRRLVGMNPKPFIHRLRIRMAIRLLRASNLSVTSIAYECGYRSLNYFHKHFKEQHAVTPREFRKLYRAAG